jgi:hypothetical protein
MIDPQMTVTSIWFDFNIGKNDIGEEGEIEQTILISDGAGIKALDIQTIDEEKRKELHRLLDYAIKEVNTKWELLRKYGKKYKHNFPS